MRATASFPPELQSASQARHFAELQLQEWGLDDQLDSTRLLVSELVINAVLHARTEATLTLMCRPEVLRVEVADGSTVALAKRSFSTTATTGRGLMILEALASRWGVEEMAGGKSVWFELDLDPVDRSVRAAEAAASASEAARSASGDGGRRSGARPTGGADRQSRSGDRSPRLQGGGPTGSASDRATRRGDRSSELEGAS